MTSTASPEGFSVVVVGSANADLEVRVPHWPQAGESVLATAAQRFAGGKGANQAIAAAHAGQAKTALISALGDDTEAALLREALANAQVDTSLIRTVEAATGMALVMLDPTGANVITVIPGANSLVEVTSEYQAVLQNAQVVLSQLEIPLEAVAKAAQAAGGLFVLNAAPSVEVPSELFTDVDVLIVNQQEARDIATHSFGLYPSDNKSLMRALQRLVPSVVMTRGMEGCLVAQAGQEIELVPALPTVPVDHTAGGDTFCGVLAARLAKGATLVEATRAATAAASITISRRGAGSSIPTASEVAQALATGTVPEARS
ncbi:MAG: PfkB family carbohydrate kinase [Bifidobacteriaceae bacterium]|nr:PfkB family carbohydrate kinase [Bifidobacteriaceae bacterium]